MLRQFSRRSDMGRRSSLASILALALVAAACGDDGAEGVEDASTSVASTPTSGSSESSADASTVSGDGSAEPGDGPVLQPAIVIDVSAPGVTSIEQLAVSPSGDKVVVHWRDMDGGARLTIYDTADGSEVISAATEREGELFWLADSEIVMVGFGGVFHFDASLVEGTLSPVDPPSCGRSTVDYFDRLAGVYFGAFNNTEVCRLDLRTGEVITYTGVNRVGVVAPEVGGTNIYVSETDNADTFFSVTLDAATLAERDRASGDRPAVLAATPDSIIRRRESGLGYILEPAGVEIPNGVFVGVPSYSGRHYGLWDSGDVLLLDAASGETVGRIEDTSANNGQNIFDWSDDDTVMAVFTSAFEVAIYRLD